MAKIAMTPDHLPALYQLARLTPIGYNGRGIATEHLWSGHAEVLTGDVLLCR